VAELQQAGSIAQETGPIAGAGGRENGACRLAGRTLQCLLAIAGLSCPRRPGLPLPPGPPHDRAMTMPIRVRRLPHAEGLPLPSYATAGAAGMDLLAAIEKPINLPPAGRKLIPTGLAIALPPGYELQIRPRSGLALNHGIMLPNSPGTIDEDFRGEIQVIVINASMEHFLITRGMRIAQAVLAPVIRAAWLEVEILDETLRGTGGFGSTGH